MPFIQRRITILSIRRPKQLGLNEELQWLGSSLGLFGERDKDKSCFRMFLELLKAAKMQQGLSSDELAMRLRLTRPTIIHHLDTLQERGLVVHERKKYLLRDESLEQLLRTLRQDMEQTIKQLEQTAKEIDEVLEP